MKRYVCSSFSISAICMPFSSVGAAILDVNGNLISLGVMMYLNSMVGFIVRMMVSMIIVVYTKVVNVIMKLEN